LAQIFDFNAVDAFRRAAAFRPQLFLRILPVARSDKPRDFLWTPAKITERIGAVENSLMTLSSLRQFPFFAPEVRSRNACSPMLYGKGANICTCSCMLGPILVSQAHIYSDAEFGFICSHVSPWFKEHQLLARNGKATDHPILTGTTVCWIALRGPRRKVRPVLSWLNTRRFYLKQQGIGLARRCKESTRMFGH